MPNDERILETMPTGTLGLIPTASCMELGKKVDSYLSTWREHSPNTPYWKFWQFPLRFLFERGKKSADRTFFLWNRTKSGAGMSLFYWRFWSQAKKSAVLRKNRCRKNFSDKLCCQRTSWPRIFRNLLYSISIIWYIKQRCVWKRFRCNCHTPEYFRLRFVSHRWPGNRTD